MSVSSATSQNNDQFVLPVEGYEKLQWDGSVQRVRLISRCPDRNSAIVTTRALISLAFLVALCVRWNEMYVKDNRWLTTYALCVNIITVLSCGCRIGNNDLKILKIFVLVLGLAVANGAAYWGSQLREDQPESMAIGFLTPFVSMGIILASAVPVPLRCWCPRERRGQPLEMQQLNP